MIVYLGMFHFQVKDVVAKKHDAVGKTILLIFAGKILKDHEKLTDLGRSQNFP